MKSSSLFLLFKIIRRNLVNFQAFFIRNTGPVILMILIALVINATSCKELGSQKEKFTNTSRYDLSKPKVLNLPQELNEISGIIYYAKDSSMFAIIDESNSLFKFSLSNPTLLMKWDFDKKRDFEDLVLKDSVFYVLVSNGDIVEIKFSNDKPVTRKIDFSNSFKQSNEFEVLYDAGDSAGLVAVCKDCDSDSRKSVTSFGVNIQDTLGQYAPGFIIDMSAVNDKLGQDKDLHASAGAINPATGELYLVSSIQKLLIIASPEGKVKEFHHLDPAIYKQPEGIAFTPEGDMIISNEFAEDGFANLLLFKNKQKNIGK